MATTDLLLIAAALLGFAVVAGRLRGTVVSAAMVFVGVGVLFGPDVLDLFEVSPGSSSVRLLAESTLALVLFSDASGIDTRRLRHEAALPSRLLGIALPLTIVVGAVIGALLVPGVSVYEALVLSVLLAPTDAALGQAVVSDTRLPSSIRQGLNVESGLNDGICVPLLFAAIAMAELDELPSFRGEILTDLVKEVGLGALAGAIAAVVAAGALRWSHRRGWLSHHWAEIVPIAAAIIAYTLALELGGSGFIAAFTGGLIFGRLMDERRHDSAQLIEEVGGVASAVTFLAFGGVVLIPALHDFTWQTAVYAVLSLTLVRMVPVAISLVGGSAARPTVAFLGWFGPRGLASIVFMLTIVEDAELTGTAMIVQVTAFTVLLSVVAHGLTAAPLTARYATWFSGVEQHRPVEAAQVDPQLRGRGVWRSGATDQR